MQVDQKLEESVRLCDTREYCDTLTVASYIIEDSEQYSLHFSLFCFVLSFYPYLFYLFFRFLSIMEKVTRGGFLTVPCRVSWKEKEKAGEWVWDNPAWFEGMGFYSLGTYVAHKLEQV